MRLFITIMNALDRLFTAMHSDYGKNVIAITSFIAILAICYFYQKEKKNERV